MNYYTADWHLFHTNIIKYDDRPFSNAEVMNDTIIRNMAEAVKPGDNLYILGDVGFAHTVAEKDLEFYLRTINCNKYLIKGNHDRLPESLLKRYFRWVKDLVEIKDNGRSVTLCHYPMMSWNKKFHGSYHLYGHVHSKTEEARSLPKIVNAFNVGVDCCKFKPVTLDQMIIESRRCGGCKHCEIMSSGPYSGFACMLHWDQNEYFKNWINIEDSACKDWEGKK